VRDARLLAFDAVDESLGVFNTIVLFGKNFGLFSAVDEGETIPPPAAPDGER
jgi:hypothetical protein